MTPEGKTIPLTYAEAGVSITAGNSLVDMIKPFVKSTGQPWAGAEIGGFGGEVRRAMTSYLRHILTTYQISLPEAGFSKDSPRIIAAIDGIGTKLIVAQVCEMPSQCSYRAPKADTTIGCRRSLHRRNRSCSNERESTSSFSPEKN